MKAQKTNYWKNILALSLFGFLSIPGTVLADNAGIGITPELTARWWQWVFSIPSSVHPLTLKETDPTGANYCMVGQEGGDWFLGGIFKTVDVSSESKQAQSEGNEGIVPFEIERACKIPLGKTILIPVLNGECNTAEELALGNDVPEDLPRKASYLRDDCAKILADAINKNTVSALFGPVDSGGSFTEKKNKVQVKRVRTVLPFSITYSPDNILSNNCSGDDEDPFLCNPDPNPSLAQVDGYWAQVRPSRPGTYKLQTYGEAPEFNFALRITYTLTVVGPKDQ